MNLSELLKTVVRTPFNRREAINLGNFIAANAEKIDYYPVTDWNGDTYVILKWPHQVPGLRILP